MMEPIISGTTIIFLKWVLTACGFSFSGAANLAALNFLIKPIGLASKPLENLLLTLAPHNLANSSFFNWTKSCKSTPLKEKDLKVLFFLCSATSLVLSLYVIRLLCALFKVKTGN